MKKTRKFNLLIVIPDAYWDWEQTKKPGDNRAFIIDELMIYW
jgi:hypothetical protein